MSDQFHAPRRAVGRRTHADDVIAQLYSKTLAEGAAPSVLLAASPLTEGVTGRYFEDNQPAPTVRSGQRGVAQHAVDPVAAQRLWGMAEAATRK
ncbi:hypothetical protein [Rhodococcus sp. AW25M09]|uniref:hypothetical protein n=1 Tax=Rhodococcus sp. AW25M09 TaxID=1268303 RepID=UPI001E543A36|nr:hypothetical protein [Rhodococcus sp. AW25M09]